MPKDFIEDLKARHHQVNAVPFVSFPQSRISVINAGEAFSRGIYIGCGDRRLDPMADIKIEQGEAYFYRPPGAVVGPEDESVGTYMELMLSLPPADEVKHVIVAGHTDCGLLRACCSGKGGKYASLYIETRLRDVKEKLMADAFKCGKADDQNFLLHELEKRSVLMSMNNLAKHGAIAEQVEEGKVKIHGWLIETETRRIYEMNPATNKFELWLQIQPAKDK